MYRVTVLITAQPRDLFPYNGDGSYGRGGSLNFFTHSIQDLNGRKPSKSFCVHPGCRLKQKDDIDKLYWVVGHGNCYVVRPKYFNCPACGCAIFSTTKFRSAINYHSPAVKKIELHNHVRRLANLPQIKDYDSRFDEKYSRVEKRIKRREPKYQRDLEEAPEPIKPKAPRRKEYDWGSYRDHMVKLYVAGKITWEELRYGRSP